jgi:TPR repeat protein
MKTFARLSFFVGTCLAVAIAAYLWNVPRMRATKTLEITPASGTFKLSSEQLNRLTVLASAGDCDSAERLGRHYLFFSRDYDGAVKWYRLAAKCPNANAKTQLIALLNNYPQHYAEVDELLREISAIDSGIADDAREAVNLGRAEAGRRKSPNF